MAFFDDEEEKRKLLLTPGINPKLPLPPLTPAPSLANLRIAPPSLAKLSPGAMTPAPTASTPDASSLGLLPSPGAPQLTKASQLYNAKADYLEKTPGRFKSGLRGALQGAIAGLAGGGGLGGALGGALGGGLVGGVSPKILRETEFNQRIKPQILERFALEDQDRAAQIAGLKAAREEEVAQADINLKNSQAYKNRLPPPAPRPVSTPRGALGPDGKIIPGTEPLPRPTVQDIVGEDGKTRTFQVFPDGSMTLLGSSAAAATKQAEIKSREGIAARHEAGASARSSQHQNNAKKETIPLSKVRAYAKAKGIKLDEAKAQVLNEGYKITGAN